MKIIHKNVIPPNVPSSRRRGSGYSSNPQCKNQNNCNNNYKCDSFEACNK